MAFSPCLAHLVEHSFETISFGKAFLQKPAEDRVKESSKTREAPKLPGSADRKQNSVSSSVMDELAAKRERVLSR